MSTPVSTADDIVQGCVKYLLGQPTVVAAVGRTDGGTPMLFQHTLYTVVEGTSSTAAVIGYNGGWSGANEYSTARFPRVSLTLWADPLRDAGKNTVDPGEVWRRINSVFEVFDKVLHRPQGGVQWWGDVRTSTCVRSAEPVVYPVPDGDGLMRCFNQYNVEMA